MKCFLASLFLAFALSTRAASVWCSQPGSGNFSGSDSNDCISLTVLNNWTNVNPGDTVNLVGTFTNGVLIAGAYVGDYGNPVTFYFEPNCNFTAPAWGQYFNEANSFTNSQPFYFTDVKGIVIDGGQNGIIQATANGAGYLAWSNRTDGITLGLDVTTNDYPSFVIKNLTITNLYCRTNGQDDAYTTGHGGDINYIVSGNGIVLNGGWTNSSIFNCHLAGTGNLIDISYTFNTYATQIYSNHLSHFSFGVQLYGSYAAQGTGWQIWANNMDMTSDWSGNNSVFHGNCIICNQHETVTNFYTAGSPTNYYNSNGLFTLTIPQWGAYGSYYTWIPGTTNDTAVGPCYFAANGVPTTNYPAENTYSNTTASLFAATNTLTFHGTPNAMVTASLNHESGATNVNMQIYRNYFGPEFGTNASNWIGVYADIPGGVQKYFIFDNLVVIDNITHASLIGNSISVGSGSFLGNNSLIQLNPIPIGVGAVAGFGGGTSWNNLLYNFNNATSFNTSSSDQRGWGWYSAIDYNNYYGISAWDAGQGVFPTNEFYNPLDYTNFPASGTFYPTNTAIYAQTLGFESNSTTNQPSLNMTTYAPLTNDTVLLNAGTNLTAFAIANGIPQLTNDYAGNPRPSTGNWTIGAYQVGVAPVAALQFMPMIRSN